MLAAFFTLMIAGTNLFFLNTALSSGQNVTLTCRAPNSNISVVEWTRADLGDGYVLFYRNKQFDPENQHPSFKNRVDLQDRQMKDGDVSLILNDVSINDAGGYECRVKAGTNRKEKQKGRGTVRKGGRKKISWITC
uniref:Ig-like domain-containing protein n=1 Tax=Maylandia zebra TaxID=106582 RepID=A0A3P9DCB6_9CICH